MKKVKANDLIVGMSYYDSPGEGKILFQLVERTHINLRFRQVNNEQHTYEVGSDGLVSFIHGDWYEQE